MRSLKVSKTSVLTLLVLPVVIALTPARAAQRKPFSQEGLEEMGEKDPPMFIFRTDLSAGMRSQHGVFTSYQVNVAANGQNITGDAANEPSICVDPTNHNKMAIGWRQFGSVNSNFRQAGWGHSENGGTTWTFPAVLDNVFRSDPVLNSDSAGQFFYLSLLQSFFDDMFRSLNGGVSWSRLGPATGGDKQWFAIDNTNSSGHSFQYQAWSTAGNNFGGRQFSRSTNGGSTWMNPINIPAAPYWGTLAVDNDGNLFISGASGDPPDQIWCVRSSNARNGAVTPSFDLVTPVDLGGDIAFGLQINPEGLIGQIFVATDRSGTSSNNNVYLLASVQPPGSAGSDVMFVRSTDGGQSFSAPQRINDDPVDPDKVHWFGALSVAPNGRLDAVWLDTRNAANNFDSQLFYSYSTDAGVTWSPNVEVSEAFDPRLGYPNQFKMGDYQTIVSDNTGADVAYCATFNGEQDIYYVRVAPLTSQLLNIATRARVLTGDQVLIAGFIITGTEAKRVMIRGSGPSLQGVGVPLSDPTLELHQGATTVATNDNWKIRSDGTSQQAEIEATTLQPANDLESAILVTLNPGPYTAIVAGKDGATGGGLVEVFDLTADADSKLANISTRGLVDTGDNVMIGGIIIGGGEGGGARVFVRAVGPSLSNLGVQGALPDPTLELHDVNGATIAANDNWKINDQTGQSQEAAVLATTLQPTNDLESAIVTTLPPGPFTAIVRGKNNTTGVGLIEVFKLP